MKTELSDILGVDKTALKSARNHTNRFRRFKDVHS